jgi:tripartite-type tricarboxylate transporter receptor subunit TctC
MHRSLDDVLPAVIARPPARRALAGLIALAAAGLVALPDASAQAWPSRPVRMIVPFAAGGAADRVARVVAERLGLAFGQQFIADNRPGAGGSIGFELLAKATPDGYTLGSASDSAALLPFTYRNLGWDPRSFTGISTVTSQPLVLAVHASVPATDVKSFVAWARSKPGQLSFGSSGHGHPQHLTGEMIKLATGIDMNHIPYKGGGAAIIDLVGGQVPIAVLGSSTVIPHHRSGKVRILAVTSARRASTLPDVPTLDEAGIKGIGVVQWQGLYGPPKLPRPLVDRLNAALRTAVATPAVREMLEAAGFEAGSSTPEQAEARMREDMQRWERLVPKLGLKFD